MIGEIISIGDELTSGQRLDTNSQWLAERLGDLGILVHYHTTVADDLDANVRVFRAAADRSDVIVVTGGLGPTADDLTREAVAKSFGRELAQDERAVAHITALFAKRNRPMPQNNLLQAMFPTGAEMVHNPHGSAPGFEISIPRQNRKPAYLVCLPGVPAEMKEMWHGSVAAKIASLQDAPRILRHRRIKCFGVGESDLEAMLPDMIRRGRDPLVGITASKATLTLRVTASGANEAECEAAMVPTVATIRECVGLLAYGEEDDELHHAVARILTASNKTLSTLEVGTCGLIANWFGELTSRGNASFVGGHITDVGKTDNVVGVEEILGGTQVTRECFHSDFALGVGPFPGSQAYEPVKPTSESARQDVEHVAIAIASQEGVRIVTTPFWGHPDILRARIAKTALNELRLTLLRQT